MFLLKPRVWNKITFDTSTGCSIYDYILSQLMIKLSTTIYQIHATKQEKAFGFSPLEVDWFLKKLYSSIWP